MKKIITLITLLISVQVFAGEKNCIKAIDYEDSKIELCYDSKDLKDSFLESTSVGKIISIELLENGKLMGYFLAKVYSVDHLSSQSCNTLDIRTSYSLRIEGLNQDYQFGGSGVPPCKSGSSISVFLSSAEESINNRPTVPLSFNCKTEENDKLSIKLSKNGSASITEDNSDNIFFQGLKGGWRELSGGIFHIDVRGLPMKDIWNEIEAIARLEISPLGTFASGSYESGTQNSGFKEVAIECTVSQD